MICLSSWHLLPSVTCILLITQTCSSNDRKSYIVYMGDQPKDMESTKLHHDDFSPEALLYSYKKSFNGLVAKLTESEAERMAEMEGVVSVFPNHKHEVHTTRSWDFLGFSQQVHRANLESDIIVGVIDSGIWPDSQSFSDQGLGPPPSKWKGSCQNITCNNKIVGAKYFRIEGVYGENDIVSPIDSDGHGTHTASTAAGNLVSSASLLGLGLGTARGGVPSARIAVHKVCWLAPDLECHASDILAAYAAAINDGVDIISVSLGSSSTEPRKYFDDPHAIGSFHAMKKGILTSKSAGNYGPNLYTMSHYAPWLLSVASSTMDRKFFTKVKLGNNMVYEGVSLNTFDLENKMYPLIYGGDAPNITGGHNQSTSRFCEENSLDENLVKGKIVLCETFRSAKEVGLLSGAAGVIMASTSSKATAISFALPATHLSENDGALILSYIKLTSDATATIFKSSVGNDSSAPSVSPTSSRGPNTITPDILKPDLAAPGVDILAAWTPYAHVTEVKGDERVVNYNIISGTSMACPHVTAAAAYIKSFHRDWSPAAIKSALMTTATPMNATLNPQAEFAYGTGQIDPTKAVNPGLIYDTGENDYVKFLCGQGYSTETLKRITNDSSSCTEANNGTVWDLNLPSFALFTEVSNSFNRVYNRIVTNVGSETTTYRAKVLAPSSLNIKVKPDVLSFTSIRQKESFTLTIEGAINEDIVSASLVWDDGTFQVRSPIVVYSTKHP